MLGANVDTVACSSYGAVVLICSFVVSMIEALRLHKACTAVP
jgi:hypothetical protein